MHRSAAESPRSVAAHVTQIHAALSDLNRQGYAVIRGVGNIETATEVARSFGTLMPQYDGQLTHQVKSVKGFENMLYSQSQNTIQVHTEAPGWNPPPQYLALFCNTQATCGGGHTDLLDGRRLLERLSDDVVARIRETPVVFPGRKPTDSSQTRPFVKKPVVERQPDGTDVFRFSFNLLSYGDYDAAVAAEVDAHLLPLGEFGRDLAARASDVFESDKDAILIPEGALLIWNNQRMLHARSFYRDPRRHLTRFWIG